MSEKKKILVFIDWFLPGYKAGGPIRSVANMIEALHDNFDFYIVTSDRDLGDKSSYSEIKLNCWIKNQTYHIQYLSPDNQNSRKIKELFYSFHFDKIYFNSLFSFKFTLLPLIHLRKNKNKIIIAPRGMLGKGALNLKKLKKVLFLNLAKVFKIYKNITWHATTTEEKKDIINCFGQKTTVFVAKNLPEINPHLKLTEKSRHTRFYFLSRISRKKNLLFAIKAFQKINNDVEIQFDIYGPIEDPEYWNICKSEIKNVQNNIKIDYKGPLKHENSMDVISSYHFLIFPSLHENYGHVIFEALSVGCPIIISDQTPWKNLEQEGIGWDISLNDMHRFEKTILKCVNMTQIDYHKMSEQAYNFSLKYATGESLISDTVNLFNNE